MRKVFISYRRSDLPVGFAGWIHQYLETRLGPRSVFRDLDSLPPGVEFLPRIKAALRECDLALVLIGPHWNPTGADGRPRLDDPNDVLRMEVAEALRRKEVHVLPVLFGIDRPPEANHLPPEIRKLPSLSAASWYMNESETSELDRLWQKIMAIERDSLESGSGPFAPRVEPVVVEPGATVGGYALEHEIGRSESSVVYRARQLALDRPVAIKVMSETAAGDPITRERFVRAGKLMAQIGHEHIIPVYDIGEATNRPFLVMHLVEGRTLARSMADTSPLSLSQAVHVVEALASALDAAHACGLVHGTITTEKILVERSSARVLLWDFSPADEPDDGDRRSTGAADLAALARVLEILLEGSSEALADPARGVPAQLRALLERAVGHAGTFRDARTLAAAARAAYQESRVASDPSPVPSELSGLPLGTSLCAQVLELADDVVAHIPDTASRFTVENVRRMLREPIQLALSGESRVGKSTLVNALLGVQVAPVDSALRNCIGWYRFGARREIDVLLRDGRRIPVELGRDGLRTADIGCDADDVAAIDARLPLEALRSLTLIDLPAVELHAGGAEAPPGGCSPEDYLRAVKSADAVLLATSGGSNFVDGTVVRTFARLRDAAGGARVSALNAVALVSTTGLVNGGGDQLAHAHLAARVIAADLGSSVAAVLPVAPMLAETVATNTVDDAMIFAVGALAELEPQVRDRILERLEGGDPLTGPVPLTRDELDHLRRTLGRDGTQRALELASAAPLTRASLLQRLREVSGLDELLRQIGGLGLRADAIRAGRALRALDKLSWKPGLEFLGDRLEELTLRGAGMEMIGLVDAFSRCVSGELSLSADKVDELQRLVTGRSGAERLGLGAHASEADRRAQAIARLTAWKAFEGGVSATQEERHVAAAVVRHYQALSEDQAASTERGRGEWVGV